MACGLHRRKTESWLLIVFWIIVSRICLSVLLEVNDAMVAPLLGELVILHIHYRPAPITTNVLGKIVFHLGVLIDDTITDDEVFHVDLKIDAGDG